MLDQKTNKQTNKKQNKTKKTQQQKTKTETGTKKNPKNLLLNVPFLSVLEFREGHKQLFILCFMLLL